MNYEDFLNDCQSSIAKKKGAVELMQQQLSDYKKKRRKLQRKAIAIERGREVNMGSFMRMKTDQKKHKPAICIIYGNHTNIKEIPISSANEVFAKKESNVKELVQTIGKDFIHGIKEDERKGITFMDRLNRKLRKEDEDVKTVIADCLQQIGE